MGASEHERISEVFLEVCDLAGDERRDALERLCAGDTALRAEVEALLGFDGSGTRDEQLEAVAAGVGEAIAALDPARAAVGDDFELLDVLGEGGMGIVYRARQREPQRIVALKILRPGPMSAERRQRFEYEVEFLGRLRHPGIAQIYATGRTGDGAEGSPYFAMELVEGPPVTDYARDAGLGDRARVELLARLCDAVQHAHERGVIHRDLKPANVLVDSDGQPKVLDFGVSRAVDPDRLQPSHRTQTGALVGTLAYMSPEQVEGDPAQIDTRTDVYALGVVLFELLSGELPHDVRGQPLHVGARRIAEEEPRRLGDALPRLRGDLEAITARALARRRADRYASASELAADLRRFLRAEPIEARRTHTWYVLGKALHRHRFAFSVGGAFLALLLGALVVTTRLYRTARDRGAEAAEARDRERLQRYAAELRLGYDAYESADFAEARRFLRAQVPAPGEADLREFAWFWLDALTRSRMRSAPAHLSTIRSLATSRDGSRIVTGGWDGAVRVWDVGSGELLATSHAHRRSVSAVAFSPDGRHVASGGWDDRVRVHDAASLEEVAVSADLGRVPVELEYAPDGGRLAVGLASLTPSWKPTLPARSRTSRVMIGPPRPGLLLELDPDTAAVEWTYPDSSAGVSAIAYGFGGELFFGTIDGSLLRLSADGRGLEDVRALGLSTIWDLALDPTRDVLLAAGGGWDEVAPVEILSTYDLERVGQLVGHDGGVTSIRVSEGRAVTSGWDRSVVEWDLGARAARRRYRGATGRLWAVGLLAPSGEVVAGGYDGRLHRWSVDEPTAARRVPQSARREKYNVVRFAPDDATLASVAEAGYVQLLGRDELDVRRRLQGHARPVRALAFAPGGARLLSGGLGGELRLWSVATGERLAEWTGHASEVWDVCFAPGGGEAYSVAGMWFGEGDLIAWDVETGEALARVEGRPADERRKGDVFRAVSVAPDGEVVAVARNVNYRPGVIELRAPRTLDLWSALEGHGREVNALAFHPSAPLLASGDAGGRVRLWDLETREFRAELAGHETEVTALAFTDDGRTLASGSVDGEVRLWDAGSGAAIGRLDADDDNLWSLDFAADGRSLVAALDRSLCLWSIDGAAVEPLHAEPPLLPVEHPSATGRVVEIDVQWQLSRAVTREAGLDPRWYALARDDARAWASFSDEPELWERAVRWAEERLEVAADPD